MSDLKLDSDLQPVFRSEKDYETIDGVSQSEQIIRLQVKDRLFGIFSRYDQDNIQNKIVLELERMADDLDFIESVQNISVEQVRREEQGSGFEVTIHYNKSETYNDIINQL